MLSPIQNIPLSQLPKLLYEPPKFEIKILGDLPETNGMSYKMATLVGAFENLNLSAFSGVIESEILSFISKTIPDGASNHWYQLIATLGLALAIAGVSRKTIKYLSKNDVRARDRLFPIVISLLGFDTAAWLMNKSKGLDNGYLGKVNRDNILKGPIGKGLTNEVTIFDKRLRTSYTHLGGGILFLLYIIDILKPYFKPTLLARKALKKVYDLSIKSEKSEILSQLLFGCLLYGFSGIPQMIVAPSIYDKTKELSGYALGKVKAKAVSFLNNFYKPKIT